MKVTKSVISVILALSIVLGIFGCYSVCSNAASEIPGRAGDANSDGAVNALDALMVIRYCTDSQPLTNDEKLRADVDGDKSITSTDALLILHFSVGKLQNFTVQPFDEANIRKIVIGNLVFYYDPSTGRITNDDGSGLLGFSYDADCGCFYASHNSWQRNFGYTWIYDYSAPFIIIWYDTTRIFFDYDNKEWMIQLWKGQYGWVLIGCEIGLYYRDFKSDSFLSDNKGRKFYKCAEDDMLVKMSLTLYRDDKQLFSRNEQYSWWLTGFVPGALTNWGFTFDTPQELTVNSKLIFKDAGMMNAFVEGLKNTHDIEHNATKKIRKVNFDKGSVGTKKNGYAVNPVDNSVTLSWN